MKNVFIAWLALIQISGNSSFAEDSSKQFDLKGFQAALSTVSKNRERVEAIAISEVGTGFAGFIVLGKIMEKYKIAGGHYGDPIFVAFMSKMDMKKLEKLRASPKLTKFKALLTKLGIGGTSALLIIDGLIGMADGNEPKLVSIVEYVTEAFIGGETSIAPDSQHFLSSQKGFSTMLRSDPSWVSDFAKEDKNLRQAIVGAAAYIEIEDAKNSKELETNKKKIAAPGGVSTK